MSSLTFISYLATMAVVTYLVRMLPLVLFRKKIKNKYVISFLYYVPYAVITAMCFPAAFYATGNMISAIIGVVVAFFIATYKKSLLFVAAGTSAAVLICELVLMLF